MRKISGEFLLRERHEEMSGECLLGEWHENCQEFVGMRRKEDMHMRNVRRAFVRRTKC